MLMSVLCKVTELYNTSQKFGKIKIFLVFERSLKFLKDHVTLKTGVMMLKIQIWSQK